MRSSAERNNCCNAGQSLKLEITKTLQQIINLNGGAGRPPGQLKAKHGKTFFDSVARLRQFTKKENVLNPRPASPEPSMHEGHGERRRRFFVLNRRVFQLHVAIRRRQLRERGIRRRLQNMTRRIVDDMSDVTIDWRRELILL